MFLITVGARIPNVFRIWMVDGRSVFEWFGFRMVFDKMATICSVFEWFLTKWPPFVRFLNGQPFENRTLQHSVLGWHSVFQVQFSSPHCMNLFKLYFLRKGGFKYRLITSKINLVEFWPLSARYSDPHLFLALLGIQISTFRLPGVSVMTVSKASAPPLLPSVSWPLFTVRVFLAVLPSNHLLSE